MCFAFVHEGVEHECVFVEYVWPDDCKFDGTPLVTRYTHTRKRALAVVAVGTVDFIVPLFTLHPIAPARPNASRVYVLNNDVYEDF